MRVLPRLSLSSNCFFIGERLPAESKCFQTFLEAVCAFLELNPFCQVNVRPVHPLRQGSPDSWADSYGRLLPICRPFQEEGYRNQIVSRLRIFPIVWMDSDSLVRKAVPFLEYLSENFFLPSVFLTRDLAEGQSWRLPDAGPMPFERVYVGGESPFECKQILEEIYLTSLLERCLDDNFVDNLKRLDRACGGFVILDPGGGSRECVRGEGSIREAADSGSCVACMLAAVHRAEPGFRLNERIEEFGHVASRLGAALSRDGRFEEALQAWDVASMGIPLARQPAELLVKKALCHHARGDLGQAMEALKAAAEQDPGSPEVRYYMGLCEFGWKDYIEAADRFLEALQLGLRDPLRQEAEYLRGISHHHLEEFDEALGALEAARKAGRRDSPVFFFLGLSRLGRGEAEQGLACLLEALAIGPSTDDLFHVLFYIAHAYKETGAFDRALEYLKRADSTQPDRKEVMNLMGYCHFKQKRHDVAIACFNRAIEIDPGSGIDHANIGSCLRDKGDREGAVAMYRKALSLDPTIEFARENLERLSK